MKKQIGEAIDGTKFYVGAQPTPAPWGLGEKITNLKTGRVDYRIIPNTQHSNGLQTIALVPEFLLFKEIQKANAAHIVKCVNLHEELIRVLEQCLKDDAGDLEVQTVHDATEVIKLAKAIT